MFIRKNIIGLITILIFALSYSTVFAENYNPIVQTWIKEVDQTLNATQNLNDEFSFDLVEEARQVFTNTKTADSEIQECDTKKWTSFLKSFLSYNNFINNWGDLVRNDCLREDLWELEDKLHEINKVGLTEAKKCNENLKNLQTLYRNLSNRIDGLRRYGENAKLEENESLDCPNCKKAQIVGTENVDILYSSEIYTEKGCKLTWEKSKKWQEEWTKLKKSINLFKNIKTLWQEKTSDFSWSFTSKDYAEAKEAADDWWENTWNAFYSYKGRQLSFRHLRDGEDSLMTPTRIGALAQSIGRAIGKVLLPPTMEELVKQYSLQLDVYQAISATKEQALVHEDLKAWESELTLKYQATRDIENDLENYLIDLDNSIQALTNPKNKIILNYYEILKNIASKHFKNLYGACKG